MSQASEHKKETTNSRFGDSSDRLSSDLEALKSNFSDLKHDMSRILTHLVDAGKSGKQVAADQAYRAVGSAKEKVHDAMDTVRDRAQDAKEYGNDMLDEVTRQIRANPGTATLIAFGVGFIASRLILRRS